MVAAVTFTELAASELLIRVRDFVGELPAGRMPAELRVALPHGLSEDQQRHLWAASTAIDEITCSTIHGSVSASSNLIPLRQISILARQ